MKAAVKCHTLTSDGPAGSMSRVEVPAPQVTPPPATLVAGGEPAAGPEPGRRQRKKQRTGDALIEAAMELFTAKGYDRTAVHGITDTVEVSEWTFFRYFR